eukprot:509799_1
MAIFHLTWLFWAKCMFSMIITIILCIILTKHLANVLSDLCTKSRKSVSYRGKMPRQTVRYKLVSWLTVISVSSFALATFLDGIRLYNYNPSQVDCTINHIILVMANEAYIAGKVSMNLIFFLRVDMVYSESAYAYSTQKLATCASVYCICLITIMIVHTLTIKTTFTFSLGNIFINCDPVYNQLVMVTGAASDLCAAFGFIAAFLYPLWKTINLVKKHGGHNETSSKLIKLGLKATILTIVAVISTVTLLLLLGFTKAVIKGPEKSYVDFFAAPMEFIVNSTCILL